MGLNHALGAPLMRLDIQELAKVAGDTFISCYPNAGLPNPMSDTGFDETPDVTSRLLREFAAEGWLTSWRGCCGTTPQHIGAIHEAVASQAPRVVGRPVFYQEAARAMRLHLRATPATRASTEGMTVSSTNFDFVQIDRFLAKLETAANDDQLRQYFSEFTVKYDTDVPPDSFGPEYRAKQFALYELLAGKSYSPANEVSNFDVDHHAISPFPYCHGSSDTVGNQLMAIGFLIKAMKLPKGAKILEFGPGWGNTTLALAKMGYRVTAVDIENNFIELIRKRAAMEQLDIQLVKGDFSYIESTEERFDCVLFFECFHHAQDHLALMASFDRVLNKNGIVCFGAEPIVEDFPIPWGLRMDGESLWAIRKNGWLELGFNKQYFRSALARHGWTGLEHQGNDSPWSTALIAKRISEMTQGYRLATGQLMSQIGTLIDQVLKVDPQEAGYAVFGPYVSLSPGAWTARLILDDQTQNSGRFYMDVVDKQGVVVVATERECTAEHCRIDFVNGQQLDAVEVRVRCPQGTQLGILGIEIGPQ